MLKRFAIRKLIGQILTKWSKDDLCIHFFVPLCLLGENEFNDLHGLTGLSRCSGELLWFRASFPAIHCFTSSWLRSDWTASRWKDGRTKSRIGMFLLLLLLGQREHWRSIWPEAVLQPDHRHKLTTCVLVHKPDMLPRLGDTLRFPQQDLYWKREIRDAAVIKYHLIQWFNEYKDAFNLEWMKHTPHFGQSWEASPPWLEWIQCVNSNMNSPSTWARREFWDTERARSHLLKTGGLGPGQLPVLITSCINQLPHEALLYIFCKKPRLYNSRMIFWWIWQWTRLCVLL